MSFTSLRREARRNADAEVKYTQGFCGEFAVALHQLTGLPIVLLQDGLDEIHAMVQVETDFIDVRGRQTWTQVCKAWQPTVGAWPVFTWRYLGATESTQRFCSSWVIDAAETDVAFDYILAHLDEYVPPELTPVSKVPRGTKA